MNKAKIPCCVTGNIDRIAPVRVLYFTTFEEYYRIHYYLSFVNIIVALHVFQAPVNRLMFVL